MTMTTREIRIRVNQIRAIIAELNKLDKVNAGSVALLRCADHDLDLFMMNWQKEGD